MAWSSKDFISGSEIFLGLGEKELNEKDCDLFGDENLLIS